MGTKHSKKRYLIVNYIQKPDKKFDEVVELCKKLGVFITPAGATHPNKYDPEDSVIRIAPTYVSIDELKNAMDVFWTSVEIIHFEVDIQFVDTS